MTIGRFTSQIRWGKSYQHLNNPYDDNTPRLNQELSRIVFTSNRDGNAEIYTMNLDGGNVQRLTSDKKNDYSLTGLLKGIG